MKWMGLLAGLGLGLTTAHAGLVVKMKEPKHGLGSAIIGLELENTFSDKIESVRAVVFLLDDQGKVVGQTTRWILGGAKDKPALAPTEKATYNFVIPTKKPFAKTRLLVTRVLLEGDKLASLKDVQIQPMAGDGKPDAPPVNPPKPLTPER